MVKQVTINATTGEVTTTKTITNDTINTIISENVRKQRNALLAECDWTQAADSVVDKRAWATYRQALRDISTQKGFPLDITWPVKPGTTTTPVKSE